MIGAGLSLARAATPMASARPASRRMKRSGPRLSGCSAPTATLGNGRTASRGAPTGDVRRRRSGRLAGLASSGGVSPAACGGALARGLASALALEALGCARSFAGVAGARVGLAVAARFWSGRGAIGRVGFTGRSEARRVSACGRLIAGRSPRGAAAAGAGNDVSSTSSMGTGSTGVGCGDGSSPVAGGSGAATGGSGTVGGGGGAAGRAGSRPRGSTYPFGSAATRTPRWTCGWSVTASLLAPTAPTSAPSVTALPRATLVAPSWSNVTA